MVLKTASRYRPSLRWTFSYAYVSFAVIVQVSQKYFGIILGLLLRLELVFGLGLVVGLVLGFVLGLAPSREC